MEIPETDIKYTVKVDSKKVERTVTRHKYNFQFEKNSMVPKLLFKEIFKLLGDDGHSIISIAENVSQNLASMYPSDFEKWLKSGVNENLSANDKKQLKGLQKYC